MIHKVMTTIGVVSFIAVGLALSACQYSAGDWEFYDEGQYEERKWFDGWDKTFAVPKR